MSAELNSVRTIAGRAVPVVLWLASAAAFADYQDGLDAFTLGDYAGAMAEWQDVVASRPDEVNPAIYAEAHYAIAKLYWQGLGVPTDLRRAHDWLLKAADLGHAGAQAKLGFLYTDGRAVRQDFGKAFEWYSKAAKAGSVDGLYNLGIFYLYGWGVEQNPTMAAQYLATASALGDEASEEALQEVLTMVAEGRAPRPPVEIEVDWGPDLMAQGPTDTTASSSDPAEPEAVTEPQSAWRDEAWIRAQDPEYYTIQVMALSERDTLEGQVAGFDDLAPLAIYVVQKASNPLYVLLQGSYADLESARAARDEFPSQVQRRDRLWIRRFAKVQELLE